MAGLLLLAVGCRTGPRAVVSYLGEDMPVPCESSQRVRLRLDCVGTGRGGNLLSAVILMDDYPHAEDQPWPDSSLDCGDRGCDDESVEELNVFPNGQSGQYVAVARCWDRGDDADDLEATIVASEVLKFWVRAVPLEPCPDQPSYDDGG